VTDEEGLLARLLERDELAFAELVEAHHTRLVRFAASFVSTTQAAEDVVQETWIAVIRGVERFEGRSTLQTWLFRICANRARSRAGSDYRLLPVGAPSPTVPKDRFDASGSWAEPLEPWSDVDDRLSAQALAPIALSAIAELPPPQKQVVTLRDVEGLSSKETCDVLSITEANQRVLLHRGRARVRATLEAARKAGQE
jgi:RNA polymerase sigma-70 factor (ECF subfamily)